MRSSKVDIHNSKTLLVIVLLLLSIFCFAVFLDIPGVRQVFGFFYLTFVPGFVFLKILNVTKLSRTETVLFSLGLSVAFLMFAGLLVNEFGFLLGISEPLSLTPLMVTLNIFMLIGGLIAYLRNGDIKFWRAKTINKPLPFVLLLSALPILSFLGAMSVNFYGNNSILLLMLIIISIVFIMGVISRKLLPSKFYSLAIVMIAIALLFHSSLISQNWVNFRSDVNLEYFVFKTTENNAHWSSYFTDLGYGRFNSMLSITILPTVYSILMNLDATCIIKVLYPLLFAFLPVALYRLWQINFSDKQSFVAAFLLIATSTFYTEMLGLCRQMVAELFFVLLLLVIFSEKMKPIHKTICFIVFTFALVTSHYGLAEIFFFFIFFVFISLIVMKRPSVKITATLVVLFFVIMHSWYIFSSNSLVFDSIVSYGNFVYQQLGQFFNPASRGISILRGLGMETSPSIWNSIGRAFAYFTEFFILAGFIGLITRRKKILLKKEYLMFTVIAMASLVALIAVPGLARTLNMTRFYHILLLFLAPLFVVGVDFFVKLIVKRRTELVTSIIILVVLVPYFLFQTNFIYEVVGTESWSLPLSKHRMSESFLRSGFGYFDQSEITGALWITKNVDLANSTIYGDDVSVEVVLGGHALIHPDHLEVLSNVTVLSANATVYLNRANLIEGIIEGPHDSWNITSISPTLDFANKVYSNGGCEIYNKASDS
jgi:uncharacterized membrane protein